ncbi:unnamed protein product [Fusarium graminearum]|uniref:Transcription factor domain-containing protein n=1 Tax=Gibberella zeae TaxID=5518 RepID=A0A9N8NJ47_GIBZA|nr:unnamed protein product [Fusarium graminearum]CAG2006813.1 unnamed protein product [Fusarium graminearum]CZS86176.1 unnamed protein product [Fusarium graminearum]
MVGGSFTFLAVDGTGRPSGPGSRAAIRSQCMKGVNVRKDSRRSKRKAKNRKVQHQENVEQDEDAIIMHRQDLSLHCTSSLRNHCLKRQLLKPSLRMSIDDCGFDSSLFPSSVLETVMKYNSIIEKVYPLDTNLIVHSWMSDDFQFLHQNRTLLSAIYLATHAVDDLRCSARLSPWTQQLLCIILSSLNRDLYQAAGQQSSTTMMTILILLFAAESLYDFGAVGLHLEGVRRLLIIRDNIFTGLDAKLLFKIQQFDLRLALAFGRPLHLALEYNDYLTLPVPPIAKSDILQRLNVNSPRVIEAFQNLQALTRDIKNAISARTDLIWTQFQSQISNIQTQLLHPNNNYPDIDEALRLGMLAFLTTLSQSPVRRPQLPELQRRLETNYIMMQDQNENYRTFTIWVLMMGCFSAVEVSNVLVGEIWDVIVSPDLTWENVRDMIVAEGLPWIDFIHGGPGKKAFGYLQAQRILP